MTFVSNQLFVSHDLRYCIKKLLREQQELKIDLNILNAAVKAQEEHESKKKLKALAVVVLDKTLKKEKDCQEQLDREVHVQRSNGHFTFCNSWANSVSDAGRSPP